jgi:single-strand DNA-binding protein
MLNRVCLVGRLTADPELRYTGSGLAVVNFRIAVDRDFKNQQGERETDFINCVAWKQRAEFVSNYIHKGNLVSVDGRLQVRSYETQDGQRRQAWDVIADSVNALESRRDREGAPGDDTPPPVADDLAPAVTDLDADSNPWGDQ